MTAVTPPRRSAQRAGGEFKTEQELGLKENVLKGRGFIPRFASAMLRLTAVVARESGSLAPPASPAPSAPPAFPVMDAV